MFQISRSRARGDLRPGQDIASARGPPPSQTRHSRHSPGPRPQARGCRHSRHRHRPEERRGQIFGNTESRETKYWIKLANFLCRDVCREIYHGSDVLTNDLPLRCLDAGPVPGVSDVCRVPGAKEREREREERAPGPATSAQSPATAGTTGQSRSENRRSNIGHSVITQHSAW